jgi:uncharacterized phiE125 gp8 family phage protein
MITKYKIYSGPIIEPVSVLEARNHLRIVVDEDDELIASLIQAAREQCEAEARRSFTTRTYEAILDDWPSKRFIKLPQPPLVSVTSVSYIDYLNVTGVMSASEYFLDTYSEPGRLCLTDSGEWPSITLRPFAGIIIRYVAGYGDPLQVPEVYKRAMLLMIGHLYENRETVIVQQGVAAIQIPQTVKMLLMTDRGNF